MSTSQPPNPFVGYSNEQFAFVGTATDSSGKDVTADCDWVWYFTKGKGVAGNPVLYAFANAGEVTVTATAHLKGDSGAATITGTISAAPLATKMIIEPFLYTKLNDGTRVDPGASVCDMCEVYMEIPPLYVCNGFETKPSSAPSWMWQSVSATFVYQIQHDGVTWSVYCSPGWSTWGERNWGVDWRGRWTQYQWPPPFPAGYATGTWTVFNTIVTSGDGVILFDPDDEALDEATIPWSISHMDYHPTFDVTVSVMTVTGSLVKTLTATAGLGAGSLTWDGSTNAGPTATKGVYTYQVSAAHRWNDYPDQLCSYSAFRADLVTVGDLHEFELDAPDDEVHYKVSDTLSRAVGSCSAKVYSPQLAECPNTPTPPTTAGAYESGTIIVPAVSGPPHTYTLVVFTTETAADGLLNRDLQPKPGLRKGGGQTYGVLALGYRDTTVSVGWGDTPTFLAQCGYSAGCSDGYPGSLNAALAGLDNASAWIIIGHGDTDPDHDPGVAMVRIADTPLWKHWLMDYEDPCLGVPINFSPGTCLNVDDYEGCWQQLRFVLLIACRSGVHCAESDLLESLVDAGAKGAVGFVDVLEAPLSYQTLFAEMFWYGVREVGSIASGCATGYEAVWERCIDDSYDFGVSGYDSLRTTEGSGAVPLKPARYGWGQP